MTGTNLLSVADTSSRGTLHPRHQTLGTAQHSTQGQAGWCWGPPVMLKRCPKCRPCALFCMRADAPCQMLLCCCRRGAPRQPHLVPAARAALQLAPSVPAACLRGLEGFSHCWVLYVFHENTGVSAGRHWLPQRLRSAPWAHAVWTACTQHSAAHPTCLLPTGRAHRVLCAPMAPSCAAPSCACACACTRVLCMQTLPSCCQPAHAQQPAGLQAAAVRSRPWSVCQG